VTGLTVAVTGPTGDIGRAFLRALEGADDVGTVLGMARRPFDPGELGLTKTRYRRGDILDRAALDELFAEADVVVHLAFVIIGSPEETRRVNLEGSRNVFAAAAAAPRVQRLVYTSSVAAYGFHSDNPSPLTEDVPPRGTDAHYYSAQKAELEGAMWQALEGSDVEAYLFRPCIVAGRDALLLIENLPYVTATQQLPASLKRVFDAMPVVRPLLPDPGVPFQLVHADDVAAALVLATEGRGEPGTYNLAGDGPLTMTDLARELGWYAFPVPSIAVDATASVVSLMPFLPAEAHWIQVFRSSVVMDTSKARRQLGWEPKRSGGQTLAELVRGARERGLV
jgi:UDP-glucose 4-epimerase